MFYIFFRIMRIPRNIALSNFLRKHKNPQSSCIFQTKYLCSCDVLTTQNKLISFGERSLLDWLTSQRGFFSSPKCTSEFTTLIRDFHTINCPPNNPFAPEVEITEIPHAYVLRRLQWNTVRHRSLLVMIMLFLLVCKLKELSLKFIQKFSIIAWSQDLKELNICCFLNRICIMLS